MNPLVKLSVRYSLVLVAIQVAIGLFTAFTINYEEPSVFMAVTFAVLGFVAYIVIIVMAHARFEKENGKITFGQSIAIGYIIIGFAMLSSIVVAIITSYVAPNPASAFGVSVTYQIAMNLVPQILIGSLILFLIILVESQWKVYTKAGKAGWASIVPFYNIIVLLEIVKKPMSWFVLLLIPLVNIVFAIWVMNLLSRRFGKDEGFTVGMILLPFVFYPILGFGSSTYNGGDLDVRPA